MKFKIGDKVYVGINQEGWDEAIVLNIDSPIGDVFPIQVKFADKEVIWCKLSEVLTSEEYFSPLNEALK